MKTTKRLIFPVLLTLVCCVVHGWQHAVAGLPYLPYNEIVPLAVLTPLLLILTFFTTFVLLKQSGSRRPVSGSFLSTAAMLLPIGVTATTFLSYCARRFAGILPVLILPDFPGGVVTMIVTALCVAHLTGLFICRLVKEKAGPVRVVFSTLGWLLLNAVLFFITT